MLLLPPPLLPLLPDARQGQLDLIIARPPSTSPACSNTQVTDAALPALAQLPLLSLDLSETRVTGCRPPGIEVLTLPSLTSLQLLQARVDDRGCRHLAAALPCLHSLALGAAAVGDKGFKALCALPQVRLSSALQLCTVPRRARLQHAHPAATTTCSWRSCICLAATRCRMQGWRARCPAAPACAACTCPNAGW